MAYEELVSFATINPQRPPILWADVQKYAELKGFDDDQRNALMHHIAALEQVSITHLQEQQRKRGGKGGTKSKSVLAANARFKQADHRQR